MNHLFFIYSDDKIFEGVSLTPVTFVFAKTDIRQALNVCLYGVGDVYPFICIFFVLNENPKNILQFLLFTAKVTTDYIYYTDGKYIDIQRNNGK